jgi:peptide/nickel transport system ATP-binding protein
MNTHPHTPGTDTVLRVKDLGIELLPGPHTRTGRLLLQGCSFELRAGERLTLVGESGAGKSLLAQAVMGTLPDVMRATGHVHLVGHDTDGQRHLTQPLWGHQVVMLPQEPWSALNPVMRLSHQVAEAGRYGGGHHWSTALQKADQHLAALGLAQAGRQWLHQVSGGMAQRVGIACASQSNARLLIADEPTKGLDAGACAQVAQLLAHAQQEGQALLTITHDLDLARHLGGQLAVMRHGTLIESGEAARVLAMPQHPYTRELVAAQPHHWPDFAPKPSPATAARDNVITADRVSVSLGGRAILKDIHLTFGKAEAVAVTGPSGCGKTTLGNVLVGARPPDSGQIHTPKGVPHWRFQKLYQDPIASFAPRQTIRLGLEHLLKLHRLDAKPIQGWLERLRLAGGLLDRYPSDVSGGELQRLAILRAMLLQPVWVFADEPTSRLDALTQRETMQTLCDALSESGCAMLLVSHDPHLAQRCTQRQLAMQSGQLASSPHVSPQADRDQS